MQLTQLQADTTLLDYSLSTAPSPVYVSESTTEPSPATLTFAISNSGDDVTVKQITFALPVGDPSTPEGADLTESAKIDCSVSDPAWRIDAGVGPGVFVMTPKAGQPIVVGDQGIAVTFTVTVSTVVGTAWISITEASVTQTGSANTGSTSIAVAKFPYGFAAGNFSLAAPLVQHGQPAVLSWFGTDAPGTTYTMFWGTTSQDVTKVRRWTSPPLTAMTTFLLEVQATTPSGSVKVWFSATEIVADPDVTAQSLKVLGETELVGAAKVDGTAAFGQAASFEGGLSATSGKVASLSVGGLTADAQAVFSGGAQFSAPAVLGAGASIGGDLLATKAAVSVLGGWQQVGTGSYIVQTDGFVLATGWPPDLTNVCCTFITVAVGTTSQTFLAGLLAFGDGGRLPLTPSVLLPVPRGTGWGLATRGLPLPPPIKIPDANVAFYWIPLGTGAAGAAEPERVSDEAPAADEASVEALAAQFRDQV